jgi:cytochrome c oxidase subunit 3
MQHQFDSLEQQKESSTLGMWMFLVTEIMFFGVLFTVYLIYRGLFHGVFATASHHLDVTMGAINTAVLIGSSLTMALSIRAAQLNQRKAIVLFLVLTILLGSVFLGIKTVEYSHKFHDHLVPGPHFAPEDPHIAAVADKAQVFFSLYFIMTGIHALHMIIGIGLLIWLAVLAWRGRFDSTYYNPLECTGLYWHFVDIVWIFLFPLLYLIGAHAR